MLKLTLYTPQKVSSMQTAQWLCYLTPSKQGTAYLNKVGWAHTKCSTYVVLFCVLQTRLTCAVRMEQ